MMRRDLLLLIAMVFVACKPRSTDHSLADDRFADALVNKIERSLDEVKEEPIRPSEILKRFDEAKKQAFFSLLASQLNRFEVEKKTLSEAIQELGLGDQQLESSMLIKFKNLLEDRQKIEKLAQKIDFFPTLHLSVIPALQSLAFKLPPKKSFPATPMFPKEDLFTLQESGCPEEIPLPPAPIANDLSIYRVAMPLTEKINPCFHHNTHVLAHVLNILAENRMPTRTPQEIAVQVANAKGEKFVNAKLSTHKDLIKLLQAAGYQVEIFSTRILVDFLGFSYRDEHQTYRPIRQPTWFIGTLENKDTPPVTGEHSELGLLIHNGDGLRLAQVRYYLGVPQNAFPGVVSFWRADTEKKARWHGMKRKVYNVYKQKTLPDLESWLDSVGDSMYAFQAVQNLYQLPFASYGFFVCSDSLVFALASYQKRNAFSGRWVDSFPIVRAGTVTYPNAPKISFSDTLSELAKIPAGFLSSTYPVDTGTAQDFKARVSSAFPKSDRNRFDPDFKDDMLPALEEYFWQ